MSPPRTILVANSRALLGKGLGETIDAFADVVRFNDWPTNNTADYGARITTHVTATGGEPDPRARRHLLTVRPKDWTHYAMYIAPSRHILPCPPLPAGKHATSGLAVALAYAGAGMKVVLAGFDHGQTGHPDGNRQPNRTAHDWETEAAIFAKLEEKNLVHHLIL